MKALVFVIIATSFTSVCFAQNCGLVEADADVVGSTTWGYLTYDVVEDRTDPSHWKDKTARYFINTHTCPHGAVGAIVAASGTWNASSWKGANDFTFSYAGHTDNYANIEDGVNAIAFQPINSANTNAVARTYILDYEWWPPWNQDRLKEVDVIFNSHKYWAFAPTANHYDIESVALHEFGHWLVLEDLWPYPTGCDEYRSAVMYRSISPATLKRVLHWIDRWGKWYIYSSGQVEMAPSAMPIERRPPPLQTNVEVLHTRLLHNYPDPFNPETWIPYELADESDVRIVIYDSHGHLVRQIDVGQQAKGQYIGKDKAVYWDGKDDNGASVASGVYFYTLRADNFSQTRRLVILK